MGRCIMKLTDASTGADYYLEWSDVVDAPVTYGVSLDEFRRYYESRYGWEGAKDLNERLVRTEKHGTSWFPPERVEDAIAGNRAGPDESEATLEQIVQWYCVERRDPVPEGEQ